jgi:CubicO group peptidase (beta-lactamase class C family)
MGSTSSSDEASSGSGAGSTGDEPVAPPCPEAIGIEPAFPGASWEMRTPDEVGLDADGVAAFIAASGDRDGVLVRCGYLVATWGNEEGQFEWASASKPVWSTFLMFAIHEGLLVDADELIAEHGWELQGADATMTFRHLANQTSGYALPEAPGEAWGYNDYAIKLYALTLFGQVFDSDANAVANEPQHFGPLQLQDGDLFGDVSGAPRVVATPRDFARVGWFWANRGTWDGTELIPSAGFDEGLMVGTPAGTPRTAGGSPDDYLGLGSAGGGVDQTGLGPGIYGFNWWFNPDGQTWPAAPVDTFQANGHWNGEVLTVIPSLGLVAAWRGNGTNPEAFDGPMNTILEALVASVVVQ